jgi:membrane-associated protease RseP (regulator of RpoE activity)
MMPPTTTQLNALPSLSGAPVGAVAVLAGIVVIHEAGHYLAARSFNITVEEFSVGFGPKVFGFDAFGNDFNLRALPLGGYVRFPENYDGEAAQENDELRRQALRVIRKERQKTRAEWNWKDEALNAATLGYWDERKIDETRKEKQLERETAKTEEGSQPFWARLFGGNNNKKQKVDGDDVDINEVYQSLDELENFEVEYYDDPQLLQNRPWPERAVVLSGGVIFNLLLALSIYFAAIGPLPVGSNEGLPRAVFDNGVVVKQDPRSDGPSGGLLRRGDIITGINGTYIQQSFEVKVVDTTLDVTSCTYNSLTHPLFKWIPLFTGQPVQIEGSTKTSVSAGQKQVTDVISVIRATPDGESVSVNVLRAEGGAAKTTPQTINIQPKRSDGSTQTIGVMLAPNFDRIERLKSDNPVVALQMAWEYLSDIFTQTLLGTLSVLTSFLSPSGPPPGQKISGPIGLISQGSSVVATKDWTTVLLFAAGLSVNLGVINALPLPALDGGQLVFVVAEAITGKKVDQKFQEGVTSIAVLFLLYVSLSAAIGDVGSLFK